MSEHINNEHQTSLTMPKRILYFVLKIMGVFSAMVIWFLAGSVFHRSFALFTRWPETIVNIAAVTGGFLIMTASTIIVGYIIGERRNGKALKKVSQ